MEYIFQLKDLPKSVKSMALVKVWPFVPLNIRGLKE